MEKRPKTEGGCLWQAVRLRRTGAIAYPQGADKAPKC
jgi:hypothetical protein